ncbi:MAG: hypothetical protein R3D00_12385 [Bacteroidia bacterium]
MHQTKLIRLLKTFSAWEIRAFDDFVRSPFFNKNPSVTRLWQLTKEFAPAFDQPELERKLVFTVIFPKEAFDEQKLRYLMTDLTRLIENFWVYKYRENHSVRFQQDITEVFQERNLTKDREESAAKLGKMLNKLPVRKTSDLLQKFLFEENEYLQQAHSRDRHHSSSVSQVMDSLDHLYLAKKLRYSCEVVNRANILQQEARLFLTTEILQQIDSFSAKDSPLIHLYHTTLLTLTDGANENHYFTLRQQLENSLQTLDKEELNHLYAFALNYAIKQFNTGRSEYGKEIFDLYKTLIENRIIFEGEQLPVPHFKNMVAIGTRLREFVWVESFIENYEKHLPESDRFNAYTYNLAYLLFEKKEFSRVLRMLSSVEFSDVFYQTDAKTVLLRTYYEIEDFDGLTYLMGSFRMFLRRNKQLSDYQRKLYLNLIKVTQLLMRYRLGEKVTIYQINQQIEKTPDIAGLNWVKAKIGELAQ